MNTNNDSVLPKPSRKRKASSLISLSPIKKKICKAPIENPIRPFWTDLTGKWSQQLRSCSKRFCDDLLPNSWTPSFKRLAHNSWFSTKLEKLSSEPLASNNKDQCLHEALPVDTPQSIPEEIQMKAIKIRIFPSKDQKKILTKWIGTARWTYNQCVDSVQTKKTEANKKELRSKFVNNANFEQENTWVPDTPYDIRDEGMNDFLKALKATKAKLTKGQIKHFKFGFRSRKDNTESIAVLKKHWGHKRGIYSDVLNAGKMKAEKELPEKLDHDSRLIRTRLGKYYLCMPKPIEIKSENQAPDEKKHCTISLDPGVRTFMTGYDADGSTFEWGKNDDNRIESLCIAYDGLQAKWSSKEVKHHQRYKLKIMGRRIQEKIRNLVDEVHKKLAKCLCENYRKILLPNFETSKKVRLSGRKIHNKTARAMLTWGHYRFKQRLLSKAREYPWCEVIITMEPYTSVTCGECGKINKELGSDKTFTCPSFDCDYIADRDVNAARNILLRHLTITNGATPLL